MALPLVTVEYPKTGLAKGSTAIRGTLVISYDREIDTLMAWSKVEDESSTSGILTGEQQVDNMVSQVGLDNIEYREYIKYRVPSRVTVLKFRTAWQADIRYVAAIIASYFDLDASKVRSHLTPFV